MRTAGEASTSSDWLAGEQPRLEGSEDGPGAAIPSSHARSGDPAELTAEVPAEPLTGSPEAAPDSAAEPRGNPERRSEPREEAVVSGRLRLAASEHECRLLNLSASGMTVIAPAAAVTVGQQLSVITQELPPLLGVVCWLSGEQFGVQFPTPLPEEVVQRTAQIRRRVRTPRAGRAKLELPSIVYFDGTRHEVVVGNISAGGLMFTTRKLVRRGQRKLIRDGQALMIEFPELLPIGAHVRWTCGSTCGVMFSKLLSLRMAEEIARMGGVSPAWLDDVRLAHADYERTIA